MWNEQNIKEWKKYRRHAFNDPLRILLKLSIKWRDKSEPTL